MKVEEQFPFLSILQFYDSIVKLFAHWASLYSVDLSNELVCRLIVGRRADCDRRPVSFEGIDQGCLGRLT